MAVHVPGMTRPWRVAWTVVAVAGALSIALGFIETFRERFCGEWRWEIARPLFWIGGSLLLAAFGALVLSRAGNAHAQRTQAVYAAAMLFIATYAVLALSVGGINVPLVSEDLFGGSAACAL